MTIFSSIDTGNIKKIRIDSCDLNSLSELSAFSKLLQSKKSDLDELDINKTRYDKLIADPILDLNLTLSAKKVFIFLDLYDNLDLKVSLSKKNAKNYELIKELVEENYEDGMSYAEFRDKRNGSSIQLVYRYHDELFDHYYDEEHQDDSYRDEYDSYDEEDNDAAAEKIN